MILCLNLPESAKGCCPPRSLRVPSTHLLDDAKAAKNWIGGPAKSLAGWGRQWNTETRHLQYVLSKLTLLAVATALQREWISNNARCPRFSRVTRPWTKHGLNGGALRQVESPALSFGCCHPRHYQYVQHEQAGCVCGTVRTCVTKVSRPKAKASEREAAMA